MPDQAENPYSYYAIKDSTRGPEPPMQFFEAYQFVFANPNWLMNILLVGVSLFIPMIGPLITFGYFMSVVHALHFRTTATYPDFDFNRISDYLTRGVWPFIVAILAQFVLTPLMLIVQFGPWILGGLVATIDPAVGTAVFLISTVLGAILFVVGSVLINLMIAYLMLRGSWTEDFMEAVNFSAAWDFATKMWLEYVLETLFVGFTGPFIVLAGLLAFCVGFLPAMGLLMFVQMHFLAQLYAIYLARGGSEIPVKNPATLAPTAALRAAVLAALAPIGPPGPQFAGPGAAIPPGVLGSSSQNPYRT